MNTSIGLRQFRYFLALCEERHFGRAAERLHISQPPLSRQIRQLEDALGLLLFERVKDGVIPTAAARAFLPEVRRTLAQAEKAIAAAKAARGAQGGRFVVGYTTVFDRGAIPQVFDQLHELFPDWQLVEQGQHSISLVRAIKNGAMDAAFIGLHTEARGLTVETIIEEPLVVALPARHPYAKRRRLDFADLAGEPMFWFERRLNPGFHDYCQSFFDRIGFRPEIIKEPTDHHILLGQIAEEKGIALIPSSLAKVKREGVVFRALKERAENLSMGIAVAYSTANRSPLLRPFLDMVRARLDSSAR